MKKMETYRDVNPLKIDTDISVRKILNNLKNVKYMAFEFPLWVRLAENPKYQFYKKNLLFIPGAVDERVHDVIHLILGRGFLPEDEAFVVGFTFGSTKEWGSMSRITYRLVSKYLYPSVYKFNDNQLEILELGVKAGEELTNMDISTIRFSDVKSLTIKELRVKFILNWSKLMDFYSKEINGFSDCISYTRLKEII